MWKSHQRFPRAVGAEGNLFLVFLRVHSLSFPPPVFLSSCRPFFLYCRKQELFILLHPLSRFGVAHLAGPML